MKELFIARIISGYISLSFLFNGQKQRLLFKKPTLDQVYRAMEIYEECKEESQALDLFSEEVLNRAMILRGFWTKDKEEQLEKCGKEIEDIKVKMYQAYFRSRELDILRKALQKNYEQVKQLDAEKHLYHSISVEGTAAFAKSRFIIGSSLYYSDGRPLFESEAEFWESNDGILESAATSYVENRLIEKDYREIARSESWRMVWGLRKCGNLFGVPIVEYTDEQKNLLSWSLMYDSIYEHPNSPPQDVIEDDDILDGWLILQKREKEKGQIKKMGEDKLSSKVANSDEIFLLANTLEDAKKVEMLNEPHAESIKKQRMNLVKQKGKVHELEMPDTKQRLHMEAAQKLAQSMRERK